jgi:hypothetical protein
MRSPVNASPRASRVADAFPGVSVDRYSFTAADFHQLLIAALPAHQDGSRDDFFASVVTRSDDWSDNPPWLAVRLSQVPQVRCLTPRWVPVQRRSARAFGSL